MLRIRPFFVNPDPTGQIGMGRVDTKFRDTKFREISHQEFISYFANFSVYFAKFREISRPSFAKFRKIKMEIVSEILRN
jgi:hypothetical protein